MDIFHSTSKQSIIIHYIINNSSFTRWHSSCPFTHKHIVMKSKIFIAVLMGFIICLLAFVKQQSTITGKVNPVDGVEMIWAINSINNSDSTRTTTADGKFTLSVKPGTYRIVVVAKPPYKNTIVENVIAREGETTDTGEITLTRLQ